MPSAIKGWFNAVRLQFSPKDNNYSTLRSEFSQSLLTLLTKNFSWNMTSRITCYASCAKKL